MNKKIYAQVYLSKANIYTYMYITSTVHYICTIFIYTYIYIYMHTCIYFTWVIITTTNMVKIKHHNKSSESPNRNNFKTNHKIVNKIRDNSLSSLSLTPDRLQIQQKTNCSTLNNLSLVHLKEMHHFTQLYTNKWNLCEIKTAIYGNSR